MKNAADRVGSHASVPDAPRVEPLQVGRKCGRRAGRCRGSQPGSFVHRQDSTWGLRADLEAAANWQMR